MKRLTAFLHRNALGMAAAIPVLATPVGVLAQQMAADAPSTSVEEIIVSAQKRDQALVKIPQSVTILDAETLGRQQADNFEDYLGLIPGLSMQSSTPGVTRISLRGINTGGVAATVGVYVDEVPFGSSSGLANGAILAGDFDTYDVARLEVLRGPQGTLYGASSLGGVMKFVTNEPDPEAFALQLQTGVETVSGGDLGYSATGLVNLPLGDRAAIRASGFYRFDDGYIDTIGNNPIPSLTDPDVNIVDGTRVDDKVNDLDTFGGRISGLFEFNDRATLRVTALLQNIESGESDSFDADPVTLQPLYGGYVKSQYHPEFTDIEYRIYSATLDWDLGFANFVSSTSFGRFDETLRLSQAFELGSLITLVFGDAETRPLSVIVNQNTSTDKVAQEFRLTSPDSDSFEWMVGAYYTDEDSAIEPQDFYPVEAGTETIAADIGRIIEVHLRSTYEEYAGFGNATVHMSPRFDLTFGARASRNEQVASQLIDQTAIGGTRDAYDDARSSENVFTWSVAPRYELNDDTAFYARVATGFRPGGPNVLPPGAPAGTPASYDSDRLTSYEVGFRGDWIDRVFSLDVSAFFLDWEDVQLFAFVNDVGINANGGTAVSKGFEFTAALQPADRLSLSLNGAYTDSYLTEDTDPVVGGLDGEPLPYVPEWSLTLAADYEWTLANDMTAYIGGDVNHTGDRTADFNQRTLAGDLVAIPSYATVDLRAGLQTERWSVEAYARNLGDERGITAVGGVAPGTNPNDAASVAIIRPRTVGLTVGVRF